MVGFAIFVAIVSLIDVSRVTAGRNAYAKDINKCLFSTWPAGVLSGKVSCTGSELCYSVSDTDPALFVSCYNTKTLIPNFTGHKVTSASGVGRGNAWENDTGTFAPSPESYVTGPKDDYKSAPQAGLFPNFDVKKQQFCSRGHLTPNADFPTANERDMTFINTNVAPQWQVFNAGNWAAAEKSVKEYAVNTKTDLYVFTGTGGKGHIDAAGKKFDVDLNKRVRGPTYYWKVVCDPKAKESVVMVAKNNIGDISTTKAKSSWDSSVQQTEKKGFIELYSLDDAKKQFTSVADLHFPPLGTDCSPTKRGTFLNTLLKKYLS